MGVALVPQTLAGTWKEGVRYCEISGDGALSEIHAIRHADNPSAAAESFLTVLKALQKPVAPGL